MQIVPATPPETLWENVFTSTIWQSTAVMADWCAVTLHFIKRISLIPVQTQKAFYSEIQFTCFSFNSTVECGTLSGPSPPGKPCETWNRVSRGTIPAMISPVSWVSDETIVSAWAGTEASADASHSPHRYIIHSHKHFHIISKAFGSFSAIWYYRRCFLVVFWTHVWNETEKNA